MKTLRYRSRDPEVYFLEEILQSLGYEVVVTTYFGRDTQRAIMDFQLRENLVVDGIVGLKTWSKLLEARENLMSFSDKLLGEQDLIDFANKYDLELAVIKAVNEIESSGKGFLIDGRPRILFEGHIFWKQLEKRGLDPTDFLTEYTENVLYPSWVRKHYEGGAAEYERLEKAAGMSDIDAVHDAAYASASYGSFQIMGFHFADLGYPTVDSFVAAMYTHEREHLKAFGRFLEANNLLRHLKSKNWRAFARGYNGAGFESNRYDTKLERAYRKYQNL
ncbi:MAG: N-acetylmuramidase family protein [Leeuwenhoekiella sp.]